MAKYAIGIIVGCLIATVYSNDVAYLTSELKAPDGTVIGWIDPSGRLIDRTVSESGEVGPIIPPGNVAPVFDPLTEPIAPPSDDGTSPLTIDRIEVGSTGVWTCSPITAMYIAGYNKRYCLSNGTSWNTGAGVFSYGTMKYDDVEQEGELLRFYFKPITGVLLASTDYDSGNHSANFVLNVVGPLVLLATHGSTIGSLRGTAEIIEDTPANYADYRFHHLSAVRSSLVGFQVYCNLQKGATYTPATFTQSISYTLSGTIDLTNVLSSPEVTALRIDGPSAIPEDGVIQYKAYAGYSNGDSREVTQTANWTCLSPTIAEFDSPGRLVTQPVTQVFDIVLRANYQEKGISVSHEKTITVIPRDWGRDDYSWPMYQGNPRHDGYLPVPLNNDLFEPLWEVQVGDTKPLNRITAASGRVYTSRKVSRLDVIDGQTGAILWTVPLGSYQFGSFPSYANEIVYIQTGNHSSDTYLRAYDARTGDPVFASHHSAQWENYYAPTIYDGFVYIDGGYYGGSYSFDAYSGTQQWFLGLPQYDRWTPAVDADSVYAYVGEYSPGLYVIDRLKGTLDFRINDPKFVWNGWSMDLAPVLGGLNNVLAIHDGRLICFDVPGRKIKYEIESRFTGQVSVANSVVYAINDGNLEARREETGKFMWRLDYPQSFVDALIVTQTHLIARTASVTYAISLDTLTPDWEYPVSGYMAMSDNRLYVAQSNGKLAEFRIPSFLNTALIGLKIEGPDTVNEYSQASYSATALYEGGYRVPVTLKSIWKLVQPSEPTLGVLDRPGHLFTRDQSGTLILKAEYNKLGTTVRSDRSVQVIHPVMTYHVNGGSGDDGGFGITTEKPFRTIQRAIREAWDGDTVEVHPGTYDEAINFMGKAITVASISQPAVLSPGDTNIPMPPFTDTLIDPRDTTDAGVTFDQGESHQAVLGNFIISGWMAGITCSNSSPTIRNCTVVHNGFGLNVSGNGEPLVENCIFWFNIVADLIGGRSRYCCVQRGAAGEGNLSEDPLFVDPVAGDYHLRSERGRYDPTIQKWMIDTQTSPCIDAGDPAMNPRLERMPNGGRINLGADGGTYFASMKEWSQHADINRDGIVSMQDLAEMAKAWMWAYEWYSR